MGKLTVGKLKKALENVPDELEIELWSDSGVDQCDDNDFDVVIEDAYKHDNKFIIYANYRDFFEDEEDEE